jgi:ferredoxin
MKHENGPGHSASEDPVAAAATGTARSVPSPLYVTAAGIPIDFHSAEFNCVDDLTDCSGIACSFEPLGDVITADMRHQMERRRERKDADASANREAAPPTVDERQCAGKDAVGAAGPQEMPENMQKAMPSLTIVSDGRSLIIDTDARRAGECSTRLGAQGLECTVVLTKAGSEDDFAPGRAFWRPLRADTLSVSGAFGAFTAELTVEGDRRPLTGGLDNKAVTFDLVLDLQSRPSYAGELLPMGYYAPGRDPSGLDRALAEMPEMRGRFIKPQFTGFLDARCIHGLSRNRDCRRCLEICPFGAIQSVDRKIIVNPYLCQGCGACALACPTDAIRLLEPSREKLLETMGQAIQEGRADGDRPPAVVISESETDDVETYGHIPFRVEQIGHVGLELLLAAVAFGAGRIAVVCRPQNPARIRKAVEGQVQMAAAILKGLGMPGDVIRLSDKVNGGAEDATTAPCRPVLAPARYALSSAPDRRTGIRLAVQSLYDRSGTGEPRLPMPEGSPFGNLAVDPAACTLCMACAVACPAGALSAGRDTPRLAFIESRCHQCGLCMDACPEHAMRLVPRILCDAATVNAPAVLREAEPFRCVVCGLPFATQAMIDRMQNKLAGHWMYAGERQQRRLQMCRICRTRDALTSQDVSLWNR